MSFVSFAIFPARYAIWYSRLILCFCINFLISFFCISGCSSRYFWYWYLDALFQALCSKRFSLCIWLRFFRIFLLLCSCNIHSPERTSLCAASTALFSSSSSPAFWYTAFFNAFFGTEDKVFFLPSVFPVFLSKYKWYFTFAFCSSFVFLV